MSYTIADFKWSVSVHTWTWIYTFSRNGTVSWRDPYNGLTGRGRWSYEKINGKVKLVTRWTPSKTWEEWEWDSHVNPSNATGLCHMAEGTYDLWAKALTYYLEPGDVVYAGKSIKRGNGTVASIVYPDEVRSGGTVAWICRNPGNFRQGEKYGAYKGKYLHVKGAGAYAIFPDETTGLRAVVSLLREYGHVTIHQAMHKYAPEKDGNNPDAYAKTLSDGLKVSKDTYLTTLSDKQMEDMAKLITGVETTEKGTPWSRDDVNLPEEIRQRMPPRLSPPTEEELRNSSIGKPW